VTGVVAHRGFRDRSPENTVRAVRRAVRDHAPSAVEVDVRPTADGDPVCLHDARLDDLTDRTGLVRETPTDEVCAARVAGTDATVPRLGDVLAAAGETPVVVEAKSSALGVDALDALCDRVLASTDRAACEVVHQSFDDRWLPAVLERTTAPVAVLASEDAAGALARAARLDARAVHLAWPLVDTPGVDAGDDAVTPATVHDAGVECWAWTVRDHGVAWRLRDAGVDALTVDDPDVVG
jgi:glycerophosphoryl diester phosphodiesterase